MSNQLLNSSKTRKTKTNHRSPTEQIISELEVVNKQRKEIARKLMPAVSVELGPYIANVQKMFREFLDLKITWSDITPPQNRLCVKVEMECENGIIDDLVLEFDAKTMKLTPQEYATKVFKEYVKGLGHYKTPKVEDNDEYWED